MNKKVIVFLSFIFSLLFVFASNGAEILEKIQVKKNYANITLNGKKLNINSFDYNNSTYVPLKTFAEALGSYVTLNKNNINVIINNGEIIDYPDKVDALNPTFDLNILKISSSNIENYKLEQNGKNIDVELIYNDNNISLKSKTYFNLNSEYCLKLYTVNGSRIIINFKTGDIEKLSLENKRKIILIPAMPDKGFNYPYYLILPSRYNVEKNKGKKNYLFVEPHNTGKVGDDLDFHIKEAYSIANGNSASIAEELGLPRIVPVIVRPESTFNDKFIYTHDLSRNTIYLDKFKKEESNYPEVFKPMDRVDLQVISMIKHANNLLRSNGWKMEDKIFMWGFSASGNFVNRFSFLHPEIVKAACYGGFPVLPISKVGNTNMIYPLGTYDYEEITGKKFDLKAYNNVAKFGYIGSNDNNNPTLMDDMWTDKEKEIIKKVLAVKEYPDRWNKTSKLFKEAGGEAQVSVYLGAGHEVFYKGMGKDYLNFFIANRESDKPVYVLPSDPSTTTTEILSKNIVTIKDKPFSYDKTTIIDAFWSGEEPKCFSEDFTDFIKKSFLAKYDDKTFAIVIAEWDRKNDSRQMNERLNKVGNTLILKAEGYKDAIIKLDGGSMSNENGEQLYVATLQNSNDIISGVKYRIYDKNGHFVVSDGVYVIRPKK